MKIEDGIKNEKKPKRAKTIRLEQNINIGLILATMLGISEEITEEELLARASIFYEKIKKELDDGK